jgi:hypothetical protein
MAEQYIVRTFESATEQETDSSPMRSLNQAETFAEKEAERLVEYLDANREDSDGARWERDSGRILVWNSISESEEVCAYVITVEEEEIDGEEPYIAEAVDEVTPTNEA